MAQSQRACAVVKARSTDWRAHWCKPKSPSVRRTGNHCLRLSPLCRTGRRHNPRSRNRSQVAPRTRANRKSRRNSRQGRRCSPAGNSTRRGRSAPCRNPGHSCTDSAGRRPRSHDALMRSNWQGNPRSDRCGIDSSCRARRASSQSQPCRPLCSQSRFDQSKTRRRCSAPNIGSTPESPNT